MSVLGVKFDDGDGFEDTEASVHCVVALMLHRNPFRSALFAVCDEVIAKGWVK